MRTTTKSSHARAVVGKHLGTDHTEMLLSGRPMRWTVIPSMPQMYDEPFADSSQLPTHLVMKLARRHVTVALLGDGGDEFFGGYNRYRMAPRVWKRLGGMPSSIRKAVLRIASVMPSGPIGRLTGMAQPADKLRKLARSFDDGRDVNSLDDVYVALVSEWPDVAAMVKGGRISPNLLDERANWPRLDDPVARMMSLDALTYLPDDVLVKVDRASMFVSLETRAPLLDRDVVQFAWSLPMAMKLRDGQGKWLLRRLLDRHVPPRLIERPKMGFGIPLDQWLRGPLRDWADDLLDEIRLAQEGFLSPRPIREAWSRHREGREACGHRLWSVLMFQAWLRAQRAQADVALLADVPRAVVGCADAGAPAGAAGTLDVVHRRLRICPDDRVALRGGRRLGRLRRRQ